MGTSGWSAVVTWPAPCSEEIDQIVLKLAPLTLGRGIPLLGSTVGFDPQAWALVEHTVLPSGTIFLTYDRLP